MNPPITEAFSLIMGLAEAMGVRKINQLPGPWECKVDDLWIFAVNGQKETVKHEPEGTMGGEIPQGHVAVWFNGWLAALMSPFGGTFLVGSDCSEDMFIEALQRRLEIERAAA